MISRRIHRSIRLLQLLQHQEGVPLAEITRWLGCSQRTAYRDLHLLKESGFAIESTARGYCIPPAPLPTVDVDSGEMLAILVALLMSPLRSSPEGEALTQRAMQKTMTACSPETRRRWLIMFRSISIATNAKPLAGDYVAALSHVARCLEQGAPMLVRDTETHVEVIPQRVLATPDGWFLRGRVRGENEMVLAALSEVEIPGNVAASCGNPTALETNNGNVRHPTERL